MIISFEEVSVVCRRVERHELALWIERRWVRPHHAGAGWTFSDIDIARIELICDLRHDMDVNDEAMSVVLSLLDNVHGLRRRLTRLATAIGRLPPESREALADHLRRLEEAPAAPGGDPPDGAIDTGYSPIS